MTLMSFPLSISLSLSPPYSLFALLSKKHNKVLEQATQSLRGRQGDNTALPDYVSKTDTHAHPLSVCTSLLMAGTLCLLDASEVRLRGVAFEVAWLLYCLQFRFVINK